MLKFTVDTHFHRDFKADSDCLQINAVTLFLHTSDAFMVFVLPLWLFNTASYIICIP
jgi:hypothetical protein